MIKTILINNAPSMFSAIGSNLSTHFPQIKICCSTSDFMEASKLIKEYQPALAFIDTDCQINESFLTFQRQYLSNIETVFISDSELFAVEAFKYNASGFLLKPIRIPEMVNMLSNTIKRIEHKKIKKEYNNIKTKLPTSMPPGNLIGIPTFEGFDFIHIDEIVRCEGMQKCTRIILLNQKDIISSYNIGVFIKLLEQYDFFSTHKSHLINLKYVKKYLKEGTITMIDSSNIPVSKRRKTQFLNYMVLSR